MRVGGGVACNKVHLATELSAGAPGVSVAHVTPPTPHTHTLLALIPVTVLNSGTSPVTSDALGGLANTGCDNTTANHGINSSRENNAVINARVALYVTQRAAHADSEPLQTVANPNGLKLDRRFKLMALRSPPAND